MKPRLTIVMGVSSCGKSTVGAALADRLRAAYIEGDDLHPQSNIDKMAGGTPLTDEDRWPWLEAIGTAMSAVHGPAVASCSSLKKSYRDRIREMAGEPVVFVYLAGARDLIAKRMAARQGHFMPTGLLDSQFEALEEPGDDELQVTIGIDRSEEAIVDRAFEKLNAF